jgi:hypothetical protein
LLAASNGKPFPALPSACAAKRAGPRARNYG